jgi:hypothetical protein
VAPQALLWERDQKCRRLRTACAEEGGGGAMQLC